MTSDFNYVGVNLGKTITRWLNGGVSLVRANQRLLTSEHAALASVFSPGTIVGYRA
jgi:hypothetical protein